MKHNQAEETRWEQERTAELAESVGFYGLVGLIRAILAAHYPQDLFAGSPDKGARFTTKLHEALAILDDNRPSLREIVEAQQGADVVRAETPQRDPLFDKAVEFVEARKSKTVTAGSLRLRFSLTYARSALLLDQLEEAGIISAKEAGKPRNVL